MPILMGLLAAALAVYFFIIRSRNAANAVGDMIDMANDVRLAARRFGFKRNATAHPVESIESPDIAVVALAEAFLSLNTLPTQDQRDAFQARIQSTLKLGKADSEELMTLGGWLVDQCGTKHAALTRLARKLNKMAGQEGAQQVLAIVNDADVIGAGGLSPSQRDALEEISRIFRMR